MAERAHVQHRTRYVSNPMSMTWRKLNERGSVMVLAAVALVPILYLAAYAIDVPHWWDYSRNLQNRADAAAFAGAAAFGNSCFAGATPGTTSDGQQSLVGKWAQLYSGAGAGEPVGNLPYTDAEVSALPSVAAGSFPGPGTGWDVTNNGYINNTKAGPVNSPLTLRLGSLNDYWLVLNGRDYAEKGGTSFSMIAGVGPATFCNSDPKEDLSDPDRATAGAAGPMLDVKVSQQHLPLFFSFISGRPTLHAHARVQLQGEASSPSEPIAVSDTGFTPCVAVNLVNASTDAVIQTVTLTKIPPANPTDPIQWDNSGSPASFTMPTSANVYLQPFLNDCNGAGTRYDSDSNTGVLMINNHPATDPVVNAGDAPRLTSGGVSVAGSCAPATQYFSVGGCTVAVNANVRFASDVTPASKRKVWVVDRTWDNAATPPAWVESAPVKLSNVSGDLYSGNLAVANQSGIHELKITWEEDEGTVGTAVCKTNPTPAACMGDFGIQAQTFGACNGCDQPDDSGPIIFARISEGALNDVNTFAGNSSHNLVITLKLAGLFASKWPDPPTVLRFPTSGNHQTGLVDCGQGNSGNWDGYVVYGGCGPGNQFIGNPLPALNPIFVNTRNTCGTPPGPPWPNGNQQDCVKTTPGARRQNIICPLVLRITGQPFDSNSNCNANGAGACPTNYWALNNGTVDVAGDPRALTMIITSAADLAAGAGSPQSWIPVRRFATFYITGWDSNIKPQCGDNENYPTSPGSKKNSQNAAVWGHWINYVDSAGTGNNQPCDVNSVQPINCVPVLTR
jgi:hypothetical protein